MFIQRRIEDVYNEDPRINIYIYIGYINKTETRGLKSKENTLNTFNLKNPAYALDAIISYTTSIRIYGLGIHY